MKWLIVTIVCLLVSPLAFGESDSSDYPEGYDSVDTQMLLQNLEGNQDKINEYLESSGMPAPLKGFASGRYTVHIGNETVGMVMEDGRLEEVKEGGIENPTTEIWADDDVIKKIMTSEDPIGAIIEAQETGELKKKDYGIIPKIKGFLMSIALKILSYFK